MPIRVLSPDLAGKIAAGEVIERPASVVKELLENALDAGADRIAVEVVGAGIDMIRVTDNGSGIPSDEIELAFQRHATSKIERWEDLEGMRTLGFRGEALASVASVAEVGVVSRTADAAVGATMTLRRGEVVNRGSRAAPVGTSITVRDLFRDVPARRKFLKSMSTEVAHISTLVTHVALAFPAARVMLTVQGRRAFQATGSGDARDVLASAFGAEAAQGFLELSADDAEFSDPAIAVSGYISSIDAHWANRARLIFFVNRRWVQSPLLVHAVEQAYQGLLPVGRHPQAVVFVDLDPRLIDVNVHPTKREVRFHRETEVFAAVQRVVRSRLNRLGPVTTWGQRTPEMPAPFAASFSSFSPPAEAPALMPMTQPEPGRSEPEVAPSRKSLPILRVVGQMSTTYIIAEGPDGMYLVDQHAAHERVLFDALLEGLRHGRVESQGLLEPVVMELTPEQCEALERDREVLQSFGFAFAPFGPTTYRVSAVPAPLTGRDHQEALSSLLDATSGATSDGDVRTKLAASLACHHAVRAGQVLSVEEQRSLLGQLETTAQPHTCPHGRPTIIHLSAQVLERQFGRR